MMLEKSCFKGIGKMCAYLPFVHKGEAILSLELSNKDAASFLRIWHKYM